jgi:hypothetical protein
MNKMDGTCLILVNQANQIHLQTKGQNKCHIIHVKGFGLGQQVSLLIISFNTLISKNINLIWIKSNVAP